MMPQLFIESLYRAARCFARGCIRRGILVLWVVVASSATAQRPQSIPTPAAASEAPLIQDIRVGLVPGAAVGRVHGYTPVTVDIETHSESFEGSLEVWFHSDSRDRHIRRLELPAQAKVREELMVRVPNTRDPLVIRLESRQRTRAEQYLVIPASLQFSNLDTRSTLLWDALLGAEQTAILSLTGQTPRTPTFAQRLQRSRTSPDEAGELLPAAACPVMHGALQYDDSATLDAWNAMSPGAIRAPLGPITFERDPDELQLRRFRRSSDDAPPSSPFLPLMALVRTAGSFSVRPPIWFPMQGADGSNPMAFRGPWIQFYRDFYSARFLRGALDTLPTHPFGYDAVDAVSIDGIDPEQIAAPQRQALLTWLRAGGTVWLSAGAAQRWEGTWMEEIAPAIPGREQRFTFEDQSVRFPATEGQAGHARSPLMGLGNSTLYVSPGLVHPEATDIIRQGDTVILARRRVGNGLVVYIGFSLAEAAQRGLLRPDASSDLSMFRRMPRPRDYLLEYLLPTYRPRTRTGLHALNVMGTQHTLSAAAGPRHLSADSVFLIGLAFLVLSVPVTALVCYRINRPLLFWPVFALWCVAGSGVIYAMMARAGVALIRSQAVHWIETEAGSELGRSTSFFALTSGYPRQEPVAIAGVAVPAQFAHQSLEGDHPPTRENNLYYTSRTVQPAEQQLMVQWNEPGATDGPRALIHTGAGSVQRGFAEALVDLGGGIEVSSESKADGSLILHIRNATGHDLRDVLLQGPPQMFQVLGDLAPGESRAVVVPEPAQSPGAVQQVGGDVRNLIERHPRVFDRLHDVEVSHGDGEGYSITRLLLGMPPAKLKYIQAETSAIRQMHRMFTTLVADNVMTLRHFSAADRPDFAWTISARFAESPLHVNLAGGHRPETNVALLIVRVPMARLIPMELQPGNPGVEKPETLPATTQEAATP